MDLKNETSRLKTSTLSAGEPALYDETAKNISRVIAIEQEHLSDLSFGDRIAETIARFCGSMAFVWAHVFGFAAWIIFNTFVPSLAFDPFPFTFLTLVVSLEAIFLSTFILVSQNLETRLTERRNHLDLQINLLAEQENTQMLRLLRMIADKVGVPCDDVNMGIFEQDVEPEELIKQIIEASDSDDKNGRIIIP